LGADAGAKVKHPAKLARLRPALARAAQKVVDAWAQDAEGVSEEYGVGGVCDDVAEAMCDVMARRRIDCRTHHWADDNHTNCLVVVDGAVWEVDVPPRVYETGAWYRYRKVEDARIAATDVTIVPLEGVLPEDLERLE